MRIMTNALEAALRSSVRGEVRFGPGDRAMYAHDASSYRQVPIGVVIPRDIDDVVAAVAACAEHDAPILARGGGTSLAGQCCNEAVVIDLSKYVTRVLEIDPDTKTAIVEAGCILDNLRSDTERHGLTFGPDPATHSYCTLGGMIGNNSCGIHSVMAGRTADNIEELEVLTYDGLRFTVGRTDQASLERIISEGGRRGEIYRGLMELRDRYAPLIRDRFPDIPRRVSGYNLDELLPENGFNVARALVGTEATCVMVLRAKTKLVDSPPKRSLLVLGYPNVYEAAAHVTEIREAGAIGLEGIDEKLIDFMNRKGLKSHEGLLPDGAGWLLVEFGGGSTQEADEKARSLMATLERSDEPPTMKLFDDEEEEHRVWSIRESGLGATSFVPGLPDAWEGWEDAAVPPERLSEYLQDFRKLLDTYDYDASLYGHFGDGCIHCRISFDLYTREGIRKYRSFVEEAADLVVSYGGSLSGEHGDGQSRAELLPKMFGNELVEAFREFKTIWDPKGRMNPGKVVDPYRLDENIKFWPNFNPPPLETHFRYPEDKGSFTRATMRCVGVGKCRREEGGTMCPSYMVTREEKHTTRGRARLLFEMLQGNPVAGAWHDEDVKDSLDLCLACKGCKGECPVNVDMATYKAEFLSHYYKGKLRPAAAYSMGLIYWWSRMASKMPRLVNRLSQSPITSKLIKRIGGIAPQRQLPLYSRRTFLETFSSRDHANPHGSVVLLWPDTFNNFFHPEILEATAQVLESAGFHVQIPRRILCCGRPLYDFGMLPTAKKLLRQILDELRPEIRSGVPIVGAEPSCVAVFRDEMINLFPEDDDAIRLKELVFTLSEFLLRSQYNPPHIDRKALVHGHCHHKAIMKFDTEHELLRKTGMEFEILDSGCCGMAGSFGFNRHHYDVSQKVGERVLLPAVRAAPPDTLLIADGFSCREQIAQLTNRRAAHIAQVMRDSLDLLA